MALLEVQDIQVYYGMIQALKGVSFSVNEGEVIALIGANGAGKTTTLHTVTGLLRAKSGHIIYDGQDITKVPPHKIVTMGMAHVPEGRRVFANMTVLQNLKMGAFTRSDKNEIDATIEKVYKRFPRLKERQNQTAGTLSGGEQQMLAMGIDFERIGAIAKSVGAYFMVDMAHIAGLVAAGLHPSPVPYADVVTTTTHKTLRGPRGGLILSKAELGAAINKAIFPGNQGGPLMHVIAGKAVCFGEALKPEFKDYQQRLLNNCKALAESLAKRGVNLVSGGTDNHLILLDLRSLGVTGKDLEKRLDEVNITANKNAIPNDPETPFVTSGLRLGTAAATTRGLDESDMDKIAEFVYLAATDFENSADAIRAGVAEICAKHPLYE